MTGTPTKESSELAPVASSSDCSPYFKMTDPLRSLPVFTETSELSAHQWIIAGRVYLRNAGVPDNDHVQRLIEKIEPRALATYGSYLDTMNIFGPVNISQLEEFLIMWNNNISTGAEYSLQLENLQYTGGSIVKFNNDFSMLINRNALLPNNTDTIYRYINKFRSRQFVHMRLLEAKFDKLSEAMSRAITLISMTNTTASMSSRSATIVHSGPEDMDVDRVAFERGIQAPVSSFLPKFEKFSQFCSKDEFFRRLKDNQCVVCAGTSHKSYRVCQVYNAYQASRNNTADSSISSSRNNKQGRRGRRMRVNQASENHDLSADDMEPEGTNSSSFSGNAN
ncbi:hypothetical protein H4S03_001393 [Coemansia sp. S3946]|nr:hypothetical protein H4S03_001393 [Coemansia sp. S3946]